MKAYNIRLSIRVLLAAVITTCVLWQPVGYPAAAAGSTKFKVTIVAASRNGSGIDSKLNHVKKQLSQLKYTRFKYSSAKRFTLSMGAKHKFKVTGWIQATVKLKWVKNNRAAFNFQMSSQSRKPVNIHYSIARPGTTMIVGPKVGGETYIIVIQALK